MATLIGNEAQSIIGVSYAVTWSGVSEMLSSMEGPQKGPTNARIDQFDIRHFREKVRDPIAGDACRRLADSIRGNVPTMQREERRAIRVWSDDGSELSIERYLSDDEMCWRQVKRPKRPGRTIRLMAEISATGYSNDYELTLRCSTIVALATWLVEEGYEVEVLAADYSTTFGPSMPSELGTVIVKQASDDLDVDAMAAVLCSQRFGYETFLKAIVHACPLVTHTYWGHVEPIPSNVLKALDVDVSVPRSIMSTEAAGAWLKGQVERLVKGNEG